MECSKIGCQNLPQTFCWNPNQTTRILARAFSIPQVKFRGEPSFCGAMDWWFGCLCRVTIATKRNHRMKRLKTIARTLSDRTSACIFPAFFQRELHFSHFFSAFFLHAWTKSLGDFLLAATSQGLLNLHWIFFYGLL